jgi:hypothetical protein
MSLSHAAARILPGLWCECDDQGIFEWKPLTLKARLLPAHNDDMAAILAELVELNFVVKFDQAGKSYGAVRNFRRYQRPKKPNSTHLLPDQYRTYVGLEAVGEELGGDDSPLVTHQLPTSSDQEHRSYPPVTHQFGTPSPKPPQMEEEGDKMKEESNPPTPLRRRGEITKSQIEDFEKFYSAYPLHIARGAAEKAFVKAISLAKLEDLVAAAIRYAAKTKGVEAKFLAHPSTWLNQKRWLDEDPKQAGMNGSHADAEEIQRKSRVDGYFSHGVWLDSWGKRPENGHAGPGSAQNGRLV